MVQAHRTYTNHTITAIARCVGCLCTSSGWYKHIEPHRTYTNHTSTEIARCEGFLYTSSGWFKHIEPHRTYTNHTISTLHTVLSLWWCVSCRFAEVRCASTTPNYDGVVRVGSLCLNHPELVHKHPTHLAISVMVWFSLHHYPFRVQSQHHLRWVRLYW